MDGTVTNSRGAKDEGAPGSSTAGSAATSAAPQADEADGVAARRQRFEREAMAHLDALYAFALKLSRSRDDAEDLVGDTMLRAFERWDQYNLGTNIRAWLFTILYHVFVSRKRRIDAREVHAPDDSEGWSAFEAVGEIDPEGRFYDSFLDDEITGVPEGTVKSRLFRGRRILQKKLVDYAVDMNYIKRPAA
jgi:RNA polymerase sigma-70 factor (ECF subfamily)